MAEVRVGMPVTRLAKWKTGFQMTAIALILLGHVEAFRVLGELLLWVAGILTFITGYQYFQKSLDYVKKMEKVASKANKAQEVKIEVSKKEPAKKTAEKKPAVKKVTAKKTAAKKTTAKKTATKKATTKKTAPKKEAAN